MKKFIVITILFLFIQHFPNAKESEVSSDYDLWPDVKITMRDGVKLSASIFKPERQQEPFPTILVRTPYIIDYLQKRAPKFMGRDYVFIAVDSRGRGNSEGEFKPLEEGPSDGYDIIQWIRKQEWSNGQVMTYGGSYTGMNQWQLLKSKPEGLVTMAPVAPVYPGIDFPRKTGGHSYRYSAMWLSYVHGNTRQTDFFKDDEYYNRKKLAAFQQHLPFYQWSEFYHSKNKTFDKWAKHSSHSDYWQSLVPNEEEYQWINFPILTVTGYFDGDQPGTMAYYNRFMKNANKKAKDNMYLLIGPYDHSGTRRPKDKLNGLVFSEDVVIDMYELHLDWYDWVLGRREQPPEHLKDKVTYYMMGANEWRSAKSLDAIANQEKVYYLSSPHGNPSSVFHSGQLTNAVNIETDVDFYRYDPLDIEHLVEEEQLDYKKILEHPSEDNWYAAPILNESEVFKKNRLVYHSAPLAEKMSIFGQIKLDAYLSINTPDTDISFGVHAILPNGVSISLGENTIRARYRHGLEQELLLKDDSIDIYRFETQFITAWEFPKGTIFRLFIHPADGLWIEKNYNAAKTVAYQTKEDALVANVKLHMSKKHPSRLILPVIE